MAKLYVGNISAQNQVLNFRLPDSPKVIAQFIAIGRQETIGGKNKELSDPEVDAFIAQMSAYGLRRAEDLNKFGEDVVPYIYSINAPIKYDTLIKAIEHNRETLKEAGHTRRKNAALGINAALSNNLPLNELEMSVEEETSGSFASETPKPIAEGYRVINNPDRPKSGRGRKRSAA